MFPPRLPIDANLQVLIGAAVLIALFIDLW